MPTIILLRANLRIRLFWCFFPESENVFADDTVYQKVENLNVELYTDRKDPELEKRLETILTEHQCPYVKTEVWIPDERMYEVLYQTQIIKED